MIKEGRAGVQEIGTAQFAEEIMKWMEKTTLS
jgi:hypothetical protein